MTQITQIFADNI